MVVALRVASRVWTGVNGVLTQGNTAGALAAVEKNEDVCCLFEFRGLFCPVPVLCVAAFCHGHSPVSGVGVLVGVGVGGGGDCGQCCTL